MTDIPILRDLVMIMVVSVPVSIVLTRVGFPTVIGFLLAGVIVGPYGLGLVNEMHEIEVLAEIGIVLLLFTIGLEFSIKRLIGLRREGIMGGGLQVGVTAAIVFGLALFAGLDLSVALLLGFIISLSSTAIVLKLLVDKGELNSAHGNLSVGVLLFQDFAVVLMVMVINSIGGAGAESSTLGIATDLLLSFVAFGLIVAAVGFVLPRFFDQVVKLRNREVFILSIVLVCMGTAWATSLFGLSLALGAFVAGLAISESEYSNQIVAEVIPFRDTFSSLFFISIGMLLDLNYFITHLPVMLALVAGIFLLKSFVLLGVGQVLRYPLRLSIIAGLGLAQIGEFSFILIKMGHDYEFLGPGLYQSLLAASIVTMALTPLSHHWSKRVAFAVGGLFGRAGARDSEAERKTPLANHVIIVGYGVNGRNLARVLKATAIDHLVVDVNMERIKTAKREGHRAYYGDTSHPEIMRKMGVARAKMVVVAISDPISTRRIVKVARDQNSAVTILVRTRYIAEVEELHRLGANQVIPEEFETSVEIFARVLKDYRIPGNIIQNQIDIVRQEGYAMLRHPSMSSSQMQKLTEVLEASVMDTFFVDAACSVAGRTLRDLDLRKKSGAMIIAVVRGGKARTNPPADWMIEPADILVVLGSHAELNEAFKLLGESCPIPEG